MTRVVVRPRIRMVLLIIVANALVLLGLSLLANGDVVAERTWLGVGLGCALTLAGAAGFWRAVRLAVVIDQSGLRVRRFLSGDRLLTWADVQSIGGEKIFLRGGRPFYAPVLQVEGLGRLAAAELGSPSQEQAEQNAADLRGLQQRALRHAPQVVRQ